MVLLYLETAKKVHEPLKEGAKDHDFCICRNDRGVLWMDDTDMSDFKNNCVTMYYKICFQKIYFIMTGDELFL